MDEFLFDKNTMVFQGSLSDLRRLLKKLMASFGDKTPLADILNGSAARIDSRQGAMNGE